MEAEERHAYGAHYTSPVDIMKIVKPTISDPWAEAIESARSAKKLNDLLERLTTLRVLDPACGSGNSLYLAYREMKRLETRICERLANEFPRDQPRLIHVNARQFFGLDINSFAIELAKVSMMIGRKLAIDELHIADEADLPLDNLDANFKAVDALLTPSPGTPGEASGLSDRPRAGRGEGSSPNGNPYANVIPTPWPPADVIIGNPPFLGAKLLKPERSPDYVNALRKLYKDVPGMADYCVYWIRRAHDHLPDCTKADPLAGRAGLVGTQNIRNNQSRAGGLDHVVKTGTIIEAVDNQPWSGEANVHVSIANWMKTQDPAIVPSKKRLWTRVNQTRVKVPGKRADKQYELTVREEPRISPALSVETDVTAAATLTCNVDPKCVYQGITPGHAGFVLNVDETKGLITADPHSAAVIHPYLTGRECFRRTCGPNGALLTFSSAT